MTPEDPILEAFRAAASDRERGASEIEAALLARLLEHASGWSEARLRDGARVLVDGQPAMANLRALAARAGREDVAAFETWARRRARVLEQLPERLAAAAWPELRHVEEILTLSRSSSVAAVVEAAWQHGWGGQVVVLDGSPGGRGRDQVRRLAALGRAVSQPDATVCRHLLDGEPLVLVGADAVGAGVFVNVCGTRMLLEQARLHGRRSVMVADTGKLVDDRTVHEIAACGPVHRDADRRWPLFEAVSRDLVDRWVHE